jgi:hypothetical protein
LQLVDGVELDQRGVIFATFIGKTRCRKEGLGKDVQWVKKLPARHFLPQFLIAEVLRFTLQGADPIHVLVSIQQGIELGGHRRREGLTEEVGEAGAFSRHHPTDHILEEGVGRNDDALRGQVLQRLAQEVEGLGGQLGLTLGFALEFVFRSAVTEMIVKQFQDDLLQGYARWPRRGLHVCQGLAWKIPCEDVAQIRGYRVLLVSEQLPLGFEVAELQYQMDCD